MLVVNRRAAGSYPAEAFVSQVVVKEVLLSAPAVIFNSYIKIRPPIVIVVSPHRIVAILAILYQTRYAVCDLCERPITVVAEQPIRAIAGNKTINKPIAIVIRPDRAF